jgi:hypothetical protein
MMFKMTERPLEERLKEKLEDLSRDKTEELEAEVVQLRKQLEERDSKPLDDIAEDGSCQVTAKEVVGEMGKDAYGFSHKVYTKCMVPVRGFATGAAFAFYVTTFFPSFLAATRKEEGSAFFNKQIEGGWVDLFGSTEGMGDDNPGLYKIITMTAAYIGPFGIGAFADFMGESILMGRLIENSETSTIGYAYLGLRGLANLGSLGYEIFDHYRRKIADKKNDKQTA